MKKYLLLFFVYPLTANAQSTDSVRHLLDTVITIMRKEALHRNEVNWDSLQKEVYQKELAPAVRLLFTGLKDGHGGLIYKGVRYGMAWQAPAISPAMMAQLRAQGPPKLKVSVLSGAYGYILIPPFNGGSQADNDRFAQDIRDSICKLGSLKLKGWIIDLRMDLGGNMWPMLAGLGPLIGDGKVGSFVQSQNWYIKNGNAYLDDNRLASATSPCQIRPNSKIAVLIGPLTQSSGEAVAISLAGRKNTRSFGEPTGGYVTANLTHELGRATLMVAAFWEADRNGHTYMEKLQPDVPVDAERIIPTALQWLQNEP